MYLELLGTGGFADVYKYEQLGLGRQVAIKVLLAGGSIDHASFDVESSVMARLSNHPSIVSVYQAGETSSGRPFLVMEYCPPPHLAQRVKARPLPVAKALEVTIQLAGAVETAHRLGILHRDIKPANILFTEFGRPALTDFGISVSTSSAAAGAAIGMSVPWAPPEQLSSGSPMDQTGDVYSLAATLWTTLVGRSPFSQPGGDNGTVAMSHRVRTQAVPATGREDVPASLERALQTAMSKRLEERYGSAQELARALQRIQAELLQPVTPIEVRDALERDASHENGGPEAPGTRIVGFAAADAAPTVSKTAPGLTRRTAHQEESTGIRQVVLAPAPTDPVVAPASSRRRGMAAQVLGGIALVLAAAGVVAYLQDQPSSPADADRSHGPQDSTGAGSPPSPEITSVRRQDGLIRLAWRNPDPKVDDTYRFRLDDPDEDPVRWHLAGTETEGVVEPAPGRGCVMVVTVRAGTRSEPATACTERGGSG